MSYSRGVLVGNWVEDRTTAGFDDSAAARTLGKAEDTGPLETESRAAFKAGSTATARGGRRRAALEEKMKRMAEEEEAAAEAKMAEPVAPGWETTSRGTFRDVGADYLKSLPKGRRIMKTRDGTPITLVPDPRDTTLTATHSLTDEELARVPTGYYATAHAITRYSELASEGRGLGTGTGRNPFAKSTTFSSSLSEGL
eukprot:PLAT13785.1.p1 GENE.PLAT13785.1~~PLAT13785.1.p1  ORF type:complete len:198 (+),score=52.30 PLAT13785.1:50-643(+)